MVQVIIEVSIQRPVASIRISNVIVQEQVSLRWLGSDMLGLGRLRLWLEVHRHEAIGELHLHLHLVVGRLLLSKVRHHHLLIGHLHMMGLVKHLLGVEVGVELLLGLNETTSVGHLDEGHDVLSEDTRNGWIRNLVHFAILGCLVMGVEVLIINVRKFMGFEDVV